MHGLYGPVHHKQITANPETAGEILPYAMTNLIEAYESVKLYENALQTARDFITRYPNDPTIRITSYNVCYTKLLRNRNTITKRIPDRIAGTRTGVRLRVWMA